MQSPAVLRSLAVCLAVAATACSSASGGGPALQLLGDYEATGAGSTVAVTFSDPTHFLMVGTAADGASDSVLQGTYSIDEAGDSVTFNDDATGATLNLPFQATDTSGTSDAGADTDAAADTGAVVLSLTLLGTSLVPEPGTALVTQTGAPLVAEVNQGLVDGFNLSGQPFHLKSHKVITCGEPDCSLSRWQARTPQELASGSHYYDELGNDLGVMTPKPLVNVGMRHAITLPGTGKITMVYAFAGGVAGWVPEALFNHGHGVNMPTYEDPPRNTVASYRFQIPSDKADYADECINPGGCNGKGENTLGDYLPGSFINLPEGVPTPTDPSTPSVHGSVVSATSVKIDDPKAIFHASSVTVRGVLWDYNGGTPTLSKKTVEWVYGEIDGRWCWTPRMGLVKTS